MSGEGGVDKNTSLAGQELKINDFYADRKQINADSSKWDRTSK